MFLSRASGTESFFDRQDKIKTFKSVVFLFFFIKGGKSNE